MKLVTRLVDSVLYGTLAAWLPAAILVCAAIALPEFRDAVPRHISGEQGSFYSAVAGVGATLLGFLIAAIAVTASLPRTGRLASKMRSQGTSSRVVSHTAAACAAMGLATITGLVGLVVDVPPEAPLCPISPVPLSAQWIWISIGASTAAGALLVIGTAGVVRSVALLAGDENGSGR